MKFIINYVNNLNGNDEYKLLRKKQSKSLLFSLVHTTTKPRKKFERKHLMNENISFAIKLLLNLASHKYTSRSLLPAFFYCIY